MATRNQHPAVPVRRALGPSASARRPAVRQALADWLAQARATLHGLSAGATAIHAEATANPDGEVARAIGGNLESLLAIGGALDDADSYVCDVYLTPDDPLPDPVAVARGS